VYNSKVHPSSSQKYLGGKHSKQSQLEIQTPNNESTATPT